MQCTVDNGWDSEWGFSPLATGVRPAIPLAASDCGFLITSAVALPNGQYELCVQSNEQVSAQTWVVTDGPNTLGTGSQPNICWTFSVSNPLFFIEHTVVECGTCTQAIFILGEELCQPDIVQTEVQNCNLETSISIDITNLGIPYVITFGDGSPAQQSTAGEITHNYGQPGLYDICLSYFVPGNEIGYITCCYPVEIVLPQACICPEDFVDLVSVEPCTWAASLSFDLELGVFPIVVDFGDGTTDTVTTSSVVHEYPGPGVYNLCFRFEPFPGDTLECCELINIPGCCLDASFTLAPDYANGWESCLNPTYIVTPTACLNPVIEVTHIWEFSDGTIFNGPFPPPHIFTNFVDADGEVCVTHTIICCDESVSDTVCVDHFPGAYLGTAGGQLELDDILPSTGQNVLTFIQQNASNSSLPLLIDGLLIVNINASFVGGTWNMGRNSEILVRGNSALPRRNFSLYSTTIRSAVRIPNFPACCRWKGIRSERLTDIRMYSAKVMDAEYAIHYPTFTAGSPFPNILSANSNFENNFYVIKSNRQHVVFSNFNGNTLNGTTLSPHVCGCTAVNAIDFRDVSGVTTVNIDDKGFGRNEIFNYERGFNFQNTRLIARGFDIHDLREYDPSPGVPNNPAGQTALGIDFLWWLSSNSSLEIDRISFTDFDEQGALSYAVRDRIFRGRHTLRASASSQGSINTAGIAGGYDISIFSPARLEGGSIIQRNTLLTDGTGNAGLGFGITGNFFNTANNLFEIRDNDITVATGSNNPLNGGIVMTSTEDIWNAFIIENNTINLALTDGVGIGVNGARGYCVRKNWIGNASDATGIQLSGGGDATVECNEVLFKPTGIAALLSDENTYSGNSLSGNVNDMHFTGDCRGLAGSTIRWNQFDFSWGPSLVYDNGSFTRAQHLNNTNYNSWTGQGNQGGGNMEVQHANTNPNSFDVLQSRFRRPSNVVQGSIHFPNHSLGMMVNSNSTTITSIPDGFCTSTNGCFAMLLPPDDPDGDYEALVQDTATWNVLTTAQQTYLRQGIYGLLLENPTWVSGSSTLSGFKASHDGSFVGQSETLRHDWLQLMDDIAAHQATLQPIYDSLDVLADQLQQWFDAIAADSSLEASLQGQMDAAIQQGEALAAQLQQAEDQFELTVQTSVTQILAQNTALDGSTQYGWNEKRYNEIALKWLAGAEPDATAANDLRTIAQTCLPDGGRAVLDARGLCAVWLKEYYDEGNCANLQPRSSGGAVNEGKAASPELHIVPNPADDLVRISLNLPMTEGGQVQVQVFNLSGQNIHMATLSSENASLPISVKRWPEGLYVAKVIAHNKIISKTFVVQHR